jgi:hypothetical protein
MEAKNRKWYCNFPFTSLTHSDAEALAPTWVSDKEHINCMLCGTDFTVLRRRHHCRSCGKLVCNGCSEHKMVLPNLGSERVRVCDICFLGQSELADSPVPKKDRSWKTSRTKSMFRQTVDTSDNRKSSG